HSGKSQNRLESSSQISILIALTSNQSQTSILKQIISTITFKHWFALGCLFLLHQIVQKGFQINLLWLDHYLDPILLSPIILYLYKLEQNFITNKNKIQTPLSNMQI